LLKFWRTLRKRKKLMKDDGRVLSLDFTIRTSGRGCGGHEEGIREEEVVNRKLRNTGGR
jgi:hypothetical protein